jgi:urease accessory protein
MAVVRVGVGGAVGSGKTALVERMTPKLIARGFSPGIIANDIFTQEDALILRRTLGSVLEPQRIVGVETGSCPHSAVREDPTANLEAIDTLTARFPGIDVVLIEAAATTWRSRSVRCSPTSASTCSIRRRATDLRKQGPE